MSSSDTSSPSIEFGRFKVLLHRRELLAEGRPVELGARAFDVLMALIDAHGNILSKDELMSRVWPGRIVEENSLQAQISALRKAFAADRDMIRTVAGRGYHFAGDIRVATAAPAAPYSPTNLPGPVSELISRNAAVGEVADLVSTHRLVTLTGAGGIGKTRLGMEVARQMLPRFADGVWVAELGPLSDPVFVAVTVATTLGLTLAGNEASHERIAKAIGSRQLLLVLDNCEHVIEAAARMAEILLRASPGVFVMATSREPLRAEGECIYQVPPLDVPAEGTESLEKLLQAGAVKLFIARARAVDQHYLPDQRVAAIIGAICRRLDGIPLAIELAAAGVATLGVEEVATRLHDRFRLLTGGRRTALPRHQTLQATFDWSYELLPEAERLVLRRLAVFAGGFTLETASAVVAGAEITECDVVDCVANLVAKSLVVAEVGTGASHYRLLETTRAYAFEKLAESGEFDAFARRHADYFRNVFERAEAEWETQPTTEWLAAHGRQIGNVRAALDWAFSSSGDAAIGVALTAASVPLWFQLSLVNECLGRVKRALARIGPETIRNQRCDMQLFAALGGSLMYTVGPGPETKAAWSKVLEIAESLGDADYQMRALWGLCVASITSGKHRNALGFARRLSKITVNAADPADALVGERMVGVSLHVLGDQSGARRHIEHMLSQYVAPIRRSHIVRFQYDQRVAARAFLSRIHWLQGFPDLAMRTAQSNVNDAQAIDHALSLCHALAQAACPIALLIGDLETAERSVTMLLDQSEKHALAVWHAWGRALMGTLIMKRGDAGTGVKHLRAALDEYRESKFFLYHTAFLGNLAEGLASIGQVSEGLAAIDKALSRSEHDEERWCTAELLRIKGELVLLEASPNAAAAAENHFLQSLDWARQQGTLSWELRTAISLARLRDHQDRPTEAVELLEAAYGRFTEGFLTADLVAAKTLLDTWRGEARADFSRVPPR